MLDYNVIKITPIQNNNMINDDKITHKKRNKVK